MQNSENYSNIEELENEDEKELLKMNNSKELQRILEDSKNLSIESLLYSDDDDFYY